MIDDNIPRELGEFIEKYLSDGVLSDKEHSVIMRKAKELNIPTDELEVYIEMQLHKKAKAKKRKNAILGFLLSKWLLCILEIVFFFSMYTIMDNIESKYRENYRKKRGDKSAVWSDVKTAEGYKISIAIGGIIIFLIMASCPASSYKLNKPKDSVSKTD